MQIRVGRERVRTYTCVQTRALEICAQEHMNVPAAVIDQIIAGANSDIRQTIQHLNLLSADKKAAGANASEQQTTFKDVSIVSVCAHVVGNISI